MKQLIGIVLIGITLGIGLSGCSEESDMGVVVAEEPSLVFRSSGVYDLSEYLVPTEDQINNYRDKVYQDITGTHTYTSDANETFYSLNYETNGTVIDELKEDSVVNRFSMQLDRILLLDIEKNSTMVYVRYTDENQYVVLAEEYVGSGEKVDIDKRSCQVISYSPQREVLQNEYTDVLNIECQFDSTNHSILAETEIKTVIDTHYYAYYAKGIGLIESIYDSCTSNTFGNLTEKKCKKTVTELTTYN